jgi:DnaJ family protein C protein 9
VKKAYYKLSLAVHPDRAPENKKDHATKSFQVLGKIMAVLSDKDKRAIYDETGECITLLCNVRFFIES